MMKHLFALSLLSLCGCEFYYEKGEFPSVVSLQAQNGMLQICSGILIRYNEAIFAAQCLLEEDFPSKNIRVFRHLHHYQIVAGISSVLRIDVKYEWRTPVSWIVHPKAKFEATTHTWQYDLGMIQFNMFSTTNINIKPLIMLNSMQKLNGTGFLSNSTNSCLIVGWEKFNLATQLDVIIKPSERYKLKGVKLENLEEDECLKLFCDHLNFCERDQIFFNLTINKCFKQKEHTPLCSTGAVLLCDDKKIAGLATMYKQCEEINAPLVTTLLHPILYDFIQFVHNSAERFNMFIILYLINVFWY